MKLQLYKSNLMAFLSEKDISRIGRLIGTIAYFMDVRHRRIVRRNLQFAYPEWSSERIKMFSRQVFQNIGITVLEIIQLTVLSGKQIVHSVRIKGEENLFGALNGDKGAILISAHLGNWEMAILFVSLYLKKPLSLVTRELDNKMLDRWINRIRTRFGSEIFYKKGALNQMSRTLRNGGIIGLLLDQEARTSEAVPVTFFSGKANATPVAALLARRYNCPVIPIFCVRDEPDKKFVFIVKPPISLKKTKDIREDIKFNTQIMTWAIEEAIRAYPKQWLWPHKRWKRHHPELYPEDMARHERRKKKKKARINKKNAPIKR